MTDMKKSKVARALAALLVVGTMALAAPGRAQALTMEEAQDQIEEANATYDEANARIDELNEQIEETEARISEIEAQLPGKREAAAQSIRSLYKMQQSSNGLVELILSSESFYDFLEALNYLDIIQTSNLQKVTDLVQLTEELEASQNELEAARAEAETQRDTALEAVDSAVAAREELERLAAEQAAEEEAERQAALEEAAADAAEGDSFTNASGEEVAVEVPAEDDSGSSSADASSTSESTPKDTTSTTTSDTSTTTDTSSADTTTTTPTDQRSVFVSTWTTRINNYLAGSPLAGYGYAFAEAAWDYGVDPRWSPAISCIESGKGRYCANTCNAWGMTKVGGGWASWPDWDTAIRANVRYLSGYGYTISMSAAATYCPPGGPWYSSVSAQMQVVWGSDSL